MMMISPKRLPRVSTSFISTPRSGWHGGMDWRRRSRGILARCALQASAVCRRGGEEDGYLTVTAIQHAESRHSPALLKDKIRSQSLGGCFAGSGLDPAFGIPGMA